MHGWLVVYNADAGDRGNIKCQKLQEGREREIRMWMYGKMNVHMPLFEAIQEQHPERRLRERSLHLLLNKRNMIMMEPMIRFVRIQLVMLHLKR